MTGRSCCVVSAGQRSAHDSSTRAVCPPAAASC
jgi:hypothetical protein